METQDAAILVVDDDPGMLRAVSRILSHKHHRIVVAGGGAAALEAAREEVFDLAILDIRMPDVNGFDLMRTLKKDQPGLDVIIMTGNAEDPDENLLRAIDEGAYYFIQKPFDRRVMLALVHRCLERRRLRDERERFLDRVGRELEEARQFQLSLLPPPDYAARGLTIAARYQASNELAGDIYDYAETQDGGVSLLIADVAGHGTSAAMVTGVVKAGFRASHVDDFEPCKVVDRIREGIRDFDPGRFVTLCCIRLHPDRDEMEYVNAGHPESIILGRDGSIRLLDSTGPILSSALCDFPCAQLSAAFGAGESLLLYTDGVTEARGLAEMFGRDRMLTAFLRGEGTGAERLDAVLDDVRRFAGASARDDDVTLLTLTRGGS